jgi:hypothetical protein
MWIANGMAYWYGLDWILFPQLIVPEATYVKEIG